MKMAEIVLSSKALAVNPLKVSQPIGASLAFLGLARCMPLEHGARGCTSFNKLFFMRHFREPIPLQTTAMDMVTTVIGADDNVVEALRTIAERNRPDIIGLITTGLSETQGADIPRTIKEFRAAYPHFGDMAVVPVNATDTLGCLETGFARAVESIIETLVPAGAASNVKSRQVNILASSMLGTGDIEAIKEWVEAFDLHPVLLPDIADSLDGHMIEAGFSTLTYGGVSRSTIATMGESLATLVIGPSLNRAADLLKKRTGVPVYRFGGAMGLQECDAFTQALSKISGRPVPQKIERHRDQLLDAMIDSQFYLAQTPVAVAADPDLLGTLCLFLNGMGAEVKVAVASSNAPQLSGLPVDKVLIGDLEDLEISSRQSGVELVIANSHGTEIARRLGVPLLRAGFPQYDIVGGYARTWVGYRGGRQVLFDLANLMAGHWQEIRPYRSLYWQDTPRAAEVMQ
jgi:nitrogenase molybdenum-iron protein NifN